eukprot:GHVU01078281.1.p2 GENE.GHVU01078281.1~~GHVU01078281.1.p2  ORF type:complete len:109 (+),score=23.42 GHVU01078281.1:110-436(+)
MEGEWKLTSICGKTYGEQVTCTIEAGDGDAKNLRFKVANNMRCTLKPTGGDGYKADPPAVMSTRMLGNDEQNAIETAITKFIPTTTEMKLDGDKVIITNPEGQIVVTK